jgi:hypothetical protein
MKFRPVHPDFTFCLPGSPKVNAAAHVRLAAGRELLRISASSTAPSGNGGFSLR